ncbi:NlpC/P60 family protein [Clostridium sp. AF32-12BH]|uniref:C40 family peptidase n=1 Tax=Clostridium sp. AF32-12BH TaxID=2292006 RepID=UPI000E48EA6C|nr:NlpC/P60 family protein [Clostridium sp. AF32-12BH]RHP41959.1 hydrolase [Clostridium sp. AF32-12BH]
MKKWKKVLAVSCLCAAAACPFSAYADAAKSPHEAMLVAAPADYENIAVSQVTDYVNIREQATTNSKIVGKIYNNCAATILETVEGEGGSWYRIQSGTVNGFIKSEYFITGQEAETLAQSIGREFVTVSVDNLRLREEPNLTSNVLTMISSGSRYVVQGDEGDFYKVEVDADLIGYIAKSYCKVEVEFDQAVSLEEERAKLEEEAQRKRDAQTALANLEQVIKVEENKDVIISANPEQSDDSAMTNAPTANTSKDQSQTQSPSAGQSGSSQSSAGNQTVTSAPSQKSPSQTGSAQNSSAPNGSSQTSSSGPSTTTRSSPVAGPGSSAAVVSATRTAIVAYAKQFLGNPYVYGGTSLTNGADCSGFTQEVFAHFGITTGRSSRDQAAKGKEISLSAIQPGDLLFYASGSYINHVAIYIGNGQIIHSSNPTTGITITKYNYRTPCKAVTFLD